MTMKTIAIGSPEHVQWLYEPCGPRRDEVALIDRDGREAPRYQPPFVLLVRDGGTWTPDEDAAVELMAAADPQAAAIEMRRSSPMRGLWQYWTHPTKKQRYGR